MFLATPIREIRAVLKYLDNHEQKSANVSALTMQRATQLLVECLVAVNGGKPPEIDYKQLLPYPDWKPEGAKITGPSAETVAIARKLFGQRRIPLCTFLAIQTPLADRS